MCTFTYEQEKKFSNSLIPAIKLQEDENWRIFLISYLITISSSFNELEESLCSLITALNLNQVGLFANSLLIFITLNHVLAVFFGDITRIRYFFELDGLAVKGKGHSHWLTYFWLPAILCLGFHLGHKQMFLVNELNNINAHLFVRLLQIYVLLL